MTYIAILNLQDDLNIAQNIIKSFDNIDAKFFLYSHKTYDEGSCGKAIIKIIPTDCDNISKMHNFIVKDIHNDGYDGILHVVEDKIKIDSDPTQFLADIEIMMKEFDFPLWLNTTCDVMNYVYSKYNPRMVVEFDDPKWQALSKLDGIVFTSHSNLAWIAYDMSKYNEALYLMNEQFSVRMFAIVELLARRKMLLNGPKSLALMNMYLTVKSESKTFTLAIPDNENASQDVMRQQNELFTSLGLDITPDNTIDDVLERVYNILISKQGN